MSCVSIVIRLQAGWLGFDSWQGVDFLFNTVPRLALGCFLGIKVAGADIFI
jgi:hypothetical protein